MSTTAAQLASVRAAIAKIESAGQSVRYADRQAQLAEITALYKREETLIARLAAEQRAAVGGGRNRITQVIPD